MYPLAAALPLPEPGTVTAPPPHAGRRMIVVALAGASVSVALGVYGRVHRPTHGRINDLFFPSLLSMKAWLATLMLGLVLFQLFSAMWMFGRLPFARTPRWVPVAHRWSGTAAFLVSLPVAFHCLWALGFQKQDARQIAHGLFGCFFYGAFTTKLLCLHTDNLPKWRLPVVGGLLLTALTGVWLTSALWFFTTIGV